MNFKMNLLRLSGMVALCAAPAMAFYQMGGPTTVTIMDFAAESALANHRKWNLWTPPGGTPNTKNFQLDLTTKASGAAQCYIVEFQGGQATSDPDLRLWLNGSLDDDGPNLTRLPKARLWVTSVVNLTVSAYSSGHNNSDFRLITTQTTATTAAGCDDGVSPFYNQATNTTVRANTKVN